MALSFTPLHPTFAAVSSAIELRYLEDEKSLQLIRNAMAKYAVLVFRQQSFTGSEQIEFAKRLDGEIHAKTGARALGQNRFGNEALTDISNVAADGEILPYQDRRRLYGLGNQLWHTDASFENPRGRYSMLMAYVLPSDSPDTQFADTRTAYDRLTPQIQQRIAGLQVHHSIAHSRQTLGFEFSAEEANLLPGATHPLVLQLPDSGRQALYLASHAEKIIGWTTPEGRLLLTELKELATQPDLVYAHRWKIGDLVIWDNRATMHRGRPFDDRSARRELRRVTTLDVAFAKRNPASAMAYRSGAGVS